MPLDRLFLFGEAAANLGGIDRRNSTQDMVVAIGGAFAKDNKPFKEYLKVLEGVDSDG